MTDQPAQRQYFAVSDAAESSAAPAPMEVVFQFEKLQISDQEAPSWDVITSISNLIPATNKYQSLEIDDQSNNGINEKKKKKKSPKSRNNKNTSKRDQKRNKAGRASQHRQNTASVSCPRGSLAPSRDKHRRRSPRHKRKKTQKIFKEPTGLPSMQKDVDAPMVSSDLEVAMQDLRIE